MELLAPGAQTYAPLTLPPCRYCGGESYHLGPSARGTYYTRCKSCYKPVGEDVLETEQQLPPIPDRKLIYLDHHFYVKVSEGEARYVALYKRLYELARLQAIACPTSNLHAEENLLHHEWEKREELARWLSWGIGLHATHVIQHGQAMRAAEAWLEERPAEYTIGVCNGLSSGRLDGWGGGSGYASLQPNPALIDELEYNKRVSQKHLEGIAERWKGGDARTAFKVELERELAAQGSSWLAQLDKHVAKFIHTAMTTDGFAAMQVAYDEAPFSIHLKTQLDQLFERHDDHGTPKPAGDYFHSRTREFLLSDAPHGMPYNRIKAALWAGLARKYALEMKEPPDKGMANDVEYIATFLPYVDAMFVDNRCWQLATTNPVKDAIADVGHIGQLFCIKKVDAFEAYLDEIEATIDDERRAYVDLMYGTGRHV